jgi:hypothetical protein
MARRVKPGDRLSITAAEYNRLLAAADTIARDRLSTSAAARTHVRDAATVRVHYQGAATVPIGGIIGFSAPLGDPDVGPAELARFVRDATIQSEEPDPDLHLGRFGVTIEPIAQDKIGRVVFDGIVAARVDVKAAWHHFADVADSPASILQSRPIGSAEILWRRDPSQLGEQWAIVRVGHRPLPIYLAKILPGGIPPREAFYSGSALCELARLTSSGEIEALRDSSDDPVTVEVFNTSRQKIRGPFNSDSEMIFRLVRPEGKDGWVIDPPTQTLLCRPTRRIRSKSWGTARELRYDENSWRVTGTTIEVYNVCDYALLPTQHVVAHFHEDAAAYVGVSGRCCDGSSSSSSSGSDSSTSASESASESSSESASASTSSSTSNSSSGTSSDSASSSSSNSSSGPSSNSSSNSSSDSSSNSSSAPSSDSSSAPSSDSSSAPSSDSSSDSSSKSESESESESESASNSSSHSASHSISYSASESTSESASHSSSESDSESASNSDSESASESASESDSESNGSRSEPSASNTSESEDSNGSRTSEHSEGSEHESDKSTAIVPATFTPSGYTALFTLEAPEVRFDDVVVVQHQGRITQFAIDPRFVEVCQRGTLAVLSVQPDRPALCGATIDADGIVRIELDRDFATPVNLVVHLTGVRRGFLGKRFPDRTRQQFIANEQFLQKAYPGAGK